MFFPPPVGAMEYIAYRSVRYTDFARTTITRDILIAPGPYAVRTKSQLNKQAKHTTFYNFEEGISFAEHSKLVAESSEYHLKLKTAHIECIFQLKIHQKSGTF